MNLEDALIYLECLLLNDLDPTYIEVNDQQGFIYIFLVKDEFKYYEISERIQSVFTLLKHECPEIIKEHPLIVECYSDDELQDMLHYG